MNARTAFRAAALLFALMLPWHFEAMGGICDGISTVAGTPLTTVRVASDLLRPLFVASPPGDTSRLFIVEQDGKIRLLKNGFMQTNPFLDITPMTLSPLDFGGSEEGLLGLAFHPQYEETGLFYIFHTDAEGTFNQVVRYRRAAANHDVADAGSRLVLLSIAHPISNGHNGGMIAFGPDGYLYAGTGDGGFLCDSPGNSQNAYSLLGKILRIDVSTYPYSTPPDNPFASGGGAAETWLMGFRNPWRFSFDRATGDLYVTDVGQSAREEVNVLAGIGSGGENFGWPSWEGSLCPGPTCPAPTCSLASLVMPAAEYTHSNGDCSVTGGYVYRGCRLPDLEGAYFNSDFCSARVRSFEMAGGVASPTIDWTTSIAPGGGLSIRLVSSFGEDARGEIHIVDRGSASGTTGTGEVYKIVPALGSVEVSRPGATEFQISDDPSVSWSWEDLSATWAPAISEYRIYRSKSRGNGLFDCLRRGSLNGWAGGGDPDDPAPGQAFTYLVTALDTNGVESSPGSASTGTPRPLSSAACPN